VNAIQQIGALDDFVPGEEFKKMMTEEYGMVRQIMKTSSAKGNSATKGDPMKMKRIVLRNIGARLRLQRLRQNG